MAKKVEFPKDWFKTAKRKGPKRVTEKRKVKIGTLNVATGRVFKMRRTSNPLRTTADLLDWLYDASGGRTQPEYPSDTRMKPWTRVLLKQQVLWMYALDLAHTTYSELRIKDIADLLLTGIKPIRFSEIQADWLDSVHSDEEDPRAAILAVLEDHFGLKDPYTKSGTESK